MLLESFVEINNFNRKSSSLCYVYDDACIYFVYVQEYNAVKSRKKDMNGAAKPGNNINNSSNNINR